MVGFGRVLGGQNGPKIEILGDFWGMFFETSILVEFCLIFGKNDSEKHVDFWLFFMLFFVFFRTLETLKIVLPSRRELNFYKIAFCTREEQR